MVLFVLSSVSSAAVLEVLLLLPSLLMSRSAVIAPRVLASEAYAATPAAARLAARNAAKPAVSVLSAVATARRAAAERRAPARQRVVSPAPVDDTTHDSTALHTPPAIQPGVPPTPAFSPGAIGRSVAQAIAPLLAEQASVKKLKLKAAPGDLSAPKWPGELEVASQPGKLTLFEAARVKYVATCALSQHVPTPLHEAFDVLLVPTLRRWLGMPKGTALCVDWVSLSPALDAAIMPLLKAKFVVVSAMSLRASLKALRVRPFTSSWLDLNRAFDAFSAKWDVAVFEAQRHGVALPSPDLADILKAACAEIPCLADAIDGRQDDVLRLETAIRSFLEREEARALDPAQAKTQRPPVDPRRPSSVSFAATSPAVSPARAFVPPPSQSPSRPKTPTPSLKLLAVVAEVVQGVCGNCGLAGHSASDCVTAELFPGLGKGPSGEWRKGEREVWVKSLPPDKVSAIIAGVKKKMAAKKAARSSTLLQRTSRVSTRGSPLAPSFLARASSPSVNASRYPSFEARARVGSMEAAATPALADTGTPPNFVSGKLAASIVEAGLGVMVPVHVRISAAGVFRGECREALRTQVWFKVAGEDGLSGQQRGVQSERMRLRCRACGTAAWCATRRAVRPQL